MLKKLMKKNLLIAIILCLYTTKACAVSSILPSTTVPKDLPIPKFMELYDEFTAYSKDSSNPSIGQALTQTLAKEKSTTSSKGETSQR